ncbi:hypothetical protein [Thermococcus prieurii]
MRMGRLASLFFWEINDSPRVLVMAVGTFVIGLIFQHGLLVSLGQVGTVSQRVEGLHSMTGLVLVRAATSSNLWVVATFFVVVLTALAFRAGIERGYEAVVFSLPYSRAGVFCVKLVATLLMSVVILLVPIVLLTAVNLADVPRFDLSVLLGDRFLGLTIVLLAGLFYVVSIATLLATALRSMLMALVLAFPVLILPYLLGVNLPPRNFLFDVWSTLTVLTTDFSLSWFITEKILLYGFIVPGAAVATSLLMILGRDVR